MKEVRQKRVCTICFSYSKLECKLIYTDRKISSCLGEVRGGMGGEVHRDMRKSRHLNMFNVLDFGNSLMTVYICQNLQNCTL